MIPLTLPSFDLPRFLPSLRDLTGCVWWAECVAEFSTLSDVVEVSFHDFSFAIVRIPLLAQSYPSVARDSSRCCCILNTSLVPRTLASLVLWNLELSLSKMIGLISSL